VASLILVDSLGRSIELPELPGRIVSLVPSWTETLFELGAGPRVVGVTEYCVHPADAVAQLPKVGGTKNADAQGILRLRPDLVIANKEENRPSLVSALEQAAVPVLVTDARAVDQAAAEIALLGRATGVEAAAASLVLVINRELEALGRLSERRRCIALIWKNPYMAVGGDTFANDLLRQCGAENPFAGEAGRYPRITAQQIEAAEPEVILLPSEPYDFLESDRLELLELDCPASRDSNIHLMEGELLSWYGPRVARALREIPRILEIRG